MPRVIDEKNTRKYWAALYGTTQHTFGEWLKELVGIEHSGLLKPLDRELMIAKLGDPRKES